MDMLKILEEQNFTVRREGEFVIVENDEKFGRGETLQKAIEKAMDDSSLTKIVAKFCICNSKETSHHRINEIFKEQLGRKLKHTESNYMYVGYEVTFDIEILPAEQTVLATHVNGVPLTKPVAI